MRGSSRVSCRIFQSLLCVFIQLFPSKSGLRQEATSWDHCCRFRQCARSNTCLQTSMTEAKRASLYSRSRIHFNFAYVSRFLHRLCYFFIFRAGRHRLLCFNQKVAWKTTDLGRGLKKITPIVFITPLFMDFGAGVLQIYWPHLDVSDIRAVCSLIRPIAAVPIDSSIISNHSLSVGVCKRDF